MFPVREQLISNLGTLYSQLGNISFLGWEYKSTTTKVLSNLPLGYAAWLVQECTINTQKPIGSINVHYYIRR